jgi:hypothetical protein
MDIISGITNLTINGKPYSLTDASIKVEFSTINAEPVLGKNGVVYSKRTPAAAKISFTIVVDSQVDPTIFNGAMSVKIVAQQEGGYVINANNFASSGNLEYGLGEGTVGLEFFGQKVNFTQVG